MQKRIAYLIASIFSVLLAFSCSSRPDPISPEIKKMLKSAPYHVYITYSSECPFCIRYTQTLRDLRDSLPVNWRFKFVKVLPKEQWDFDWSRPLSGEIYHDSDRTLCKQFGLSVYPEALIVDSNARVWYRGAIDDRAHETGLSKQIVSDEYLKKVVQSLRCSQVPNISSTAAKGCFIEFYE